MVTRQRRLHDLQLRSFFQVRPIRGRRRIFLISMVNSDIIRLYRFNSHTPIYQLRTINNIGIFLRGQRPSSVDHLRPYVLFFNRSLRRFFRSLSPLTRANRRRFTATIPVLRVMVGVNFRVFRHHKVVLICHLYPANPCLRNGLAVMKERRVNAITGSEVNRVRAILRNRPIVQVISIRRVIHRAIPIRPIHAQDKCRVRRVQRFEIVSLPI